MFGIQKRKRIDINHRYPRLFIYLHTVSDDKGITKGVSGNVNGCDGILERLDAVKRLLNEYVDDVDFWKVNYYYYLRPSIRKFQIPLIKQIDQLNSQILCP